jgi:hypothetical protein
MTQVKLIWDFKGMTANKIAEHHLIHLSEFLQKENIHDIKKGYTVINELHSIAFLIVNKEDMIFYRDTLKPHRGELVEDI